MSLCRLQYRFRVPPYLTKIEIRDYLEKIYQLDVKKVNTVNWDGRKRRYKKHIYQEPDYKEAIVTLWDPKDNVPSSTWPSFSSKPRTSKPLIQVNDKPFDTTGTGKSSSNRS